MSPERDDYEGDDEEEEEEEYEEEEEPRSIFANPWFRAMLAVLVLAVVGVLALPYVQEWWASKPQVSIVKPSPPPAPAAPSPPTPAPQVAEKPAEKPAEPAPKPAAPAAPPAPASAPRVAAKPAPAAPDKGDYWVQVGAFSDAKNAGRLAAQLTDQKYAVQRATVTRGSGSGGGNEVFVAGAKQRDVYDKVKAKGYRVDAVKGGAVVRPPLPLKDAVAISKELAGAGMDVKIRRVGGGGEKATFHLVRVGGFADRTEAEAAQTELGGKGVPGFVVKGAPR